MNPEELNLMIKEGEGLTVEFKEKYTSKIDRDVVAMANSVEKIIRSLKKSGDLHRVGPDKGGYWEIANKEELFAKAGT